jgi:hypothetical protein
MRAPKLFLAALAIAPILLSAEAALAWQPIHSSEPVWPNMPYTYRINQGSFPLSITSTALASIDQSWAQWTTPGCTSFATQNLGNTTAGANWSDGVNVERWINTAWPSMYGPVNGVIGVTLPVYNNGIISDADISFNGDGFCWNNTGTGGCVDTKSIATHEQGHALGLDHTTVQGSTMEAAYSGGTSIATIEQDDIAGVCALYPATGTTSTSSSSSSTAASSSSSTGGGQSCEECTMAESSGSCSSQYNACANSTQCINFYNCAMNCGGNQTCVQGCASMYPTGAQAYQSFVQCICGACATPCATVCGGGTTSSSTTTGASTTTSTGTATTTGSGSGAGVGGNGSATGGWGSGGEGGEGGQPKPTESEGGCACHMESRGVGSGALLFVTALGAAAARKRRSRRESRG